MRLTPILAALTTACLTLLPAPAFGNPDVGAKHNGYSKADERALETYVDASKALGPVVGRNIVEDGWRRASGEVVPATDQQIAAWSARLQTMLNPPPAPEPVATSGPAVQSAPVPTPQVSVAPAPASSGGCPSYMAGEASTPDAVNGSSGASGCYQVTPGTAAAMGSACADVNASSCVAAICAAQGNAAWSSSGATPCDYIGQP